jgi:hypothetical protein
MFSSRRTRLMDAIHAGLPSPVSMSRRLGPVPTMYVFVPSHGQTGLRDGFRCITLKCELNEGVSWCFQASDLNLPSLGFLLTPE